ncbi:hypothetical protein LCGC14_0417090 [marine sediment metagenome]|uniref:HNH domain-containing protein n=1 Tax=marine sediment metagenome TaxID=412755 RepID=A0A0F9SSA8_9ZZZZ
MPYKDKVRQRECNRQYSLSHKKERALWMKLYRQRPEVVIKRREYQRKYSRRYRAAHPEITAKRRKEFNQSHRSQVNAYVRARKRKLRQEVIAHFGSKCVHCGFSDWRALQIDHINGGGSEIFKTNYCVSTYYKTLLRETPGENFQLLCANCNQIKRYTNYEGVVRD